VDQRSHTAGYQDRDLTLQASAAYEIKLILALLFRLGASEQIQSEGLCMSQICESIRWKGRDAIRLSNGTIELISLTAGGHLAAFRLLDQDGCPLQNVLWEAPWTTYDPSPIWSKEMSQLYGPPETGRFLAGFTGHALCLDYFGDPSA